MVVLFWKYRLLRAVELFVHRGFVLFLCPPVSVCWSAQGSGRSSAPSASSPSRRSARSICTKKYIRVSSPHILINRSIPFGTIRVNLKLVIQPFH